jgi:pimeloyl-ACP methyl ester carboxylesterase
MVGARRKFVGAVLMGTMLLLVQVTTAGAVTDAPGTSGTCQNVRIPVTLTVAGFPMPETIAGTLCRPSASAKYADTVQLLVHGATYNRDYWQWPLDPNRYSYVESAVKAGFATFAVDRLGYGQSSHPLSALVTMEADASTLHQVITGLRAGTISEPGFNRVVIVGHSVGSAVTMVEAGTYHDVNAVVVSGAVHRIGTGVPSVMTSVWPADIDPTFTQPKADPGYLTTLPGTRESLFYHAPNADPAIVAYDEKTKDSVPFPEVAEFFPYIFTTPALSPSIHIAAPVLVAVGQYDRISCGVWLNCGNPNAVCANERPFFPHSPRLDVATFPNMGHDLNLQITAPSWFDAANRWIAQQQTSAPTFATTAHDVPCDPRAGSA